MADRDTAGAHMFGRGLCPKSQNDGFYLHVLQTCFLCSDCVTKPLIDSNYIQNVCSYLFCALSSRPVRATWDMLWDCWQPSLLRFRTLENPWTPGPLAAPGRARKVHVEQTSWEEKTSLPPRLSMFGCQCCGWQKHTFTQYILLFVVLRSAVGTLSIISRSSVRKEFSGHDFSDGLSEAAFTLWSSDCWLKYHVHSFWFWSEVQKIF